MKTSGQDRLVVARWMIAALGSAPQLGDVVTVNAAKKVETDQALARLFTRLVAVDCAEYSGPLLRGNNNAAFRTAGGVLGKIAMRELMGNDSTEAAMEAFTRYIDQSAFEPLRK
jgi:hypothetical protein